MYQYNINISIARGDSAARALRLMHRGTVTCAETKEKAEEIIEEYLDAASVVLEARDKGIIWGVIVLLDIVNGVVVSTQLIKS